MLRILAALVLSLSAAAQAAAYKIDTAHSNVGFKIKHLMISNVKGSFKKFNGTFEWDPKNPKKCKAEAEIDAASIDTGIEARDNHLRTDDFFAVEKHPKITFKSTGVEKNGADAWLLKGELTMHGVTKEVALDLEPGGSMTDDKGKERVGFSAHGKVSRRDFGIGDMKKLKSGGLALGETVDLTIEVEGMAD